LKEKEDSLSHQSLSQNKGTSDIQLDWVWDYVQTGLNTMNQVLGLSDEKTQPAKDKDSVERKFKSKPPLQEVNDESIINGFDHSQNQVPNFNTKETQHDFFPSFKEVDSFLPSKTPGEKPREEYLSIPGIDNFAVCAAKTYHQAHGIAYDSLSLDMNQNIKVCSVFVTLPLGRKLFRIFLSFIL